MPNKILIAIALITSIVLANFVPNILHKKEQNPVVEYDSVIKLQQNKIDNLQDTSEQLEKQKQELEAQLQAKLQAKAKLASDIQAGCRLVYNYSNWNADIAYGVCMAESKGKHTAINVNDHHKTCTGSYGLLQVACFWAGYYGYKVEDLYNPAVNVAVANKIYSRSNSFNAWTTYTKGVYSRYL